MKNFKKGFTLIELLVVVAIIGILASVVLASLNTARAKGADAAIKANMDGMRAQAGIVYDRTSPLGYGTTALTGATCPATIPAATTLLVTQPYSPRLLPLSLPLVEQVTVLPLSAQDLLG